MPYGFILAIFTEARAEDGTCRLPSSFDVLSPSLGLASTHSSVLAVCSILGLVLLCPMASSWLSFPSHVQRMVVILL